MLISSEGNPENEPVVAKSKIDAASAESGRASGSDFWFFRLYLALVIAATILFFPLNLIVVAIAIAVYPILFRSWITPGVSYGNLDRQFMWMAGIVLIVPLLVWFLISMYGPDAYGGFVHVGKSLVSKSLLSDAVMDQITALDTSVSNQAYYLCYLLGFLAVPLVFFVFPGPVLMAAVHPWNHKIDTAEKQFSFVILVLLVIGGTYLVCGQFFFSPEVLKAFDLRSCLFRQAKLHAHYMSMFNIFGFLCCYVGIFFLAYFWPRNNSSRSKIE